MGRRVEVVDGWTVDKQNGDVVHFINEDDGAMVSIDTFDRRGSVANYQIKSDYKGVPEAMGRVRACKTFGGAIEAANGYMAERA